MKKFMKSLMLVAAAAMALTSCQNEEMDSIQENETFTLSFTADAPEGTRTSIAIDGNAAKFAWSVDESGNLTDRIIFLQTQDANDKVNTKYSDTEKSSIAEGIATFVSDFDAIEGATKYNYCALYPETATSGPVSLEAVVAKLPATQALTENNIDAASDLMMSQLIEGVDTQDGHGGNLKFHRLAAIGRMNLKGVPAGETIQTITITFDEAVLNGNVTINFAETTATYATTGGNAVTLSGSLTAAAETPIFFTCFPAECTGAYTIDVETDKAYYQKTGSISAEKPLTFTAGNVLSFGASVVKTEDKATDKVYTKVTKANLADYSGEYLLVYEAGNVAFDGSLATLDANKNGFTVTISENTISGDYSSKAFTIAKVEGGYSVQSAEGYYIGNSASDDNKLNTAAEYDATYLNTIENCVLKGKGGLALQYNKTSGTERFRYYKSAQQTVALYRLNGTGSDEEIVSEQLVAPTNVSAEVAGNVVTLSWDEVANASGYAVTYGETTEETTETSIELTLEYETTYNFSVVAKGDGVYYTDSAATEVPATTEKKPEGGAVVPKTVTYTVTSSSAVTVSGDAPTGSSATYKSTYGTKYQLTAGNSMTLTLSGYTGAKITGLTMSMRSNSKGGAGNYSMKVGSETISSIATANFNTASWNGAYSTDYVDITPTVTATTVGAGETIVITIAATTNSLYCQSFTLTYETIEQGGGTETPGEGGGETPDPETAKTYTMTIDASYFNSTSYAANNNEKTSTATASDGTTMEVKWTSYQVMLQSSAMQWQKSAGYIYNSTDLGTITDIAVTSSAGTFTEYIGSSKQPTANGAGGYFQIQVGGVTGKTSKIVITFTK